MKNIIKATTMILSFGLILSSCAPMMQGVCRHKALYSASLYGERYPVRLCWGLTDKDRLGLGHVQTKALINGQWVWLRSNGDIVWQADQDKFYPTKCYTVKEYVETMGLHNQATGEE